MGDNAPAEVRAVVEVPRGSTTKYELDKELGMLNVNRILQPPVPYPANYGFLPRTLDEDGDPLDALVLMQNPVVPLSILRVAPIGVVKLTDRDERDDKLLCVHIDDPTYAPYRTVADLPKHERDALEWFFQGYKETMQRGVHLEGFEGTEEAHASVERCRARYRERFGAS